MNNVEMLDQPSEGLAPLDPAARAGQAGGED